MIPKKNKLYTYKDYLTFTDDERIEIIEGEIFNMSPAPARIHQHLVMEVSSEIRSVVQPDISVICDKNKLTDAGCTGSPDMIVEIVSPSSVGHDYVTKLNLYQKYKVKEYWIIDPRKRSVFVYILTGENYESPGVYTFNDKIKVNIYDNLEIDFSAFNI